MPPNDRAGAQRQRSAAPDFIYKEKEMELIPSYYIEGGNKSIDKIDLNKFNSVEEKSEFILRDSPKYSPIDRLYNEKYIISTYIKQQELFINIYNLETNNNKTFKKDKNVSPNLPSFFSIEGKTKTFSFDPEIPFFDTTAYLRFGRTPIESNVFLPTRSH